MCDGQVTKKDMDKLNAKLDKLTRKLESMDERMEAGFASNNTKLCALGEKLEGKHD